MCGVSRPKLSIAFDVANANTIPLKDEHIMALCVGLQVTIIIYSL